MKRKLMSWIAAAALVIALTPAALAVNAEAETAYTGASPCGLYMEPDGTLIITDTRTNTISALRDGTAAALAGKAGEPDINGVPTGGYSDGAAEDALFASPWAVAPFLEGYAITDSENNSIRYVAEGHVKTVAGNGSPGLSNSVGQSARFNNPTGLAADGAGNLYIADTGNNAIRKLTASGSVTTWFSDTLREPTGICWYEGALYVADTGNQRVCRIENGKLTVLAGGAEGEEALAGGYVDGVAASAIFSSPMGVCVDGETVYVADTGNSAVRKIADGRVSTLYSLEDDPTATYPVSPTALLIAKGRLLVSDTFSGAVLSLSLGGESADFADVKSKDWFSSAVEFAVERGLFQGMSDTVFYPGGQMTRGMLVTVISRLETSAYPSVIIAGEKSFSDVSESAYYRAAAHWAADNGIAEGVSGDLFAPESPVTREELAAMLYRYAVYSDADTAGGGEAAFEAMKDASSASLWAREALIWAVGNSILEGNLNGELRPKTPATRAEAAAMLMRCCETLGR